MYAVPRRFALYAAFICFVIALALLIVLASAISANATPLTGNRGGCGRGNMWYGLSCTVTDTGPGFVSGTCQFGFWFSRVSTARTFRLDQSVKVNGCEGLNDELYAPIRIYR